MEKQFLQEFIGEKNRVSIMKQVSLIIIALFAIWSLGKAQPSNTNQIDLDFQKLVKLKCTYERYGLIASQTSKIESLNMRDSIFDLYKSQAYKIKTAPNIYLKHINHVLKNDKNLSTEETLPYKYMSVTGGGYINSRWYLIKKIDLYRVIKYSLFKKKDSILPQDFRGLPVVNEKNYNGYDKTKQGDFKSAFRFLLHNLSLSTQEVKFIKNNDNQIHVLDMKKYLDKNGLSIVNKNFITWAINYFIKDPKVSLAYLDNVYEVIRNQDYLPRDQSATKSQ
ncbi:hypothetical protein [Pedobacter sp. Hv1]|uniref:hypothetical protein n=1 Tax=Pedobacter sp. Hv1 TaxID=1740090 RepID=UPI0006D8CB4F|nr:hypothetical protein [Pedobacter sp. Hv1]KQB99153.1 hypothetical protein AQF98_16350 [Pedobacter sp. Hv1]